MDKNLRTKIQKAIEELTDSEQITLSLCATLCTNEDGISLRDLCSILGADPHIFGAEIESIVKKGLLSELYNFVYCPQAVSELLSAPITSSVINPVITNLREKTTISMNTNLVHAKPYYMMAMNLMEYVVSLEHKEGIDYEEFGYMVSNIVRRYDVFGKIDDSIMNIDHLKIMRAVKMVKGLVEKTSLLYASLCCNQARLYISAFDYTKAKPLLDEALEIEQRCEAFDELAETYFAYALYYENFGIIPLCLYNAYRAYQTIDDEALKNFLCTYIAFQLALIEDFAHCDVWLSRQNKSIPMYHERMVFILLIEALQKDSDVLHAEECLMKAEWILSQLNNDAPMKSTVCFVRSKLYAEWNLERDSNDLYYKYVNLIGQHFCGTNNPALLIYKASELNRLIKIGALIQAKQLAESLSEKDMNDSRLALSVRHDVCLALTQWYRANGKFNEAETCCALGKAITEQIIPTPDTYPVLFDVFCGNVPMALLEDQLFVWEEQAILNKFATNSPVVKQYIERLKRMYKSKNNELEVMSSSLLTAYDAVKAYHTCIVNQDSNKRYETAVMVARYAAAQGLFNDASYFYEMAEQTTRYSRLNKSQRISLLLEKVNNLVACGLRGQADSEWRRLEKAAEGTPLMADVLQQHAHSAFEKQKFEKAISLYRKFLQVYIPEPSIVDERLASVCAYLSSSYSALGMFDEALQEIIEAKKNYPTDDPSSLNLHYNHAYILVALNRLKEARKILANSKCMASCDSERESVADLYGLLALRPKERAMYFSQPSTEDLENDKADAEKL